MKHLLYSLILFILTNIIFSFSDPPGEGNTKVIVNLSPQMNHGGEMSLTINGETHKSAVDGTTARFLFEKQIKGSSKVSISYNETNWEANLQFNGIGFIKIDLFHGGISILEFSKVTFKSEKERLDVWIDGKSEGTTEIVRTIEPNENHSILWKNNGVTKCTLKIVLSPATERTYSCDGSTGKVTQQ